MLNSRPNNSKYHSGNFIPKNKDKVIKLNSEGGLYYRSSWEKIIMHWMDANDKVKKWGAECLKIPYQMTHFDNGDARVKTHVYHTDFYYEMRLDDGTLKQVVVEVKPQKEYNMVLALNNGKLKVPEGRGTKKLKNFEYDLKMAYKNKNKWETMIKWCEKKGYEFIIITEQNLKNFNVRQSKK
jgi:hypothetical protein